MGTLILAIFISCTELSAIAKRLENSKSLTVEQKTDIIKELKNVTPSCPTEFNLNEKSKS